MGFVTLAVIQTLGGCRQSQPWGFEEVSKQCQLPVPLPKALPGGAAELCQGKRHGEMLTDTEGPRLQPGNIPGTATSYRNTANSCTSTAKEYTAQSPELQHPKGHTTPPRLPGSCDSSLTMATPRPSRRLDTKSTEKLRQSSTPTVREQRQDTTEMGKPRLYTTLVFILLHKAVKIIELQNFRQKNNRRSCLHMLLTWTIINCLVKIQCNTSLK